MKKTLIAAAAAVALTASAIAEVTFSGWGRQIFVPAASDGDETYSYLCTSWGGVPRMGYAMDFTSENVDLHADFQLDDGSAKINDQLKVNIRPVEGVQLSIGKIQDDTLRGDACFGSWNWIRPNWIGDEGMIFSRTIDLNMGVEAKITAVDNLVVLAGIPVPTEGDKAKAGDVFAGVKIGAGYTIDGVGVAKVQFLGDQDLNGVDDKYTGDFEVAFKLTSVENLSAEIGFKMPITDVDDDADKTIALGASYKVDDAITVNANYALVLPGDSDLDPSMIFGVGADYALDNGIGLTADVRVAMPGNDIDPSIAFLVGASKGFSNGKLSVGFQGVNVAENSHTGLCGTLSPATDGLVWAIPVCFEYWF